MDLISTCLYLAALFGFDVGRSVEAERRVIIDDIFKTLIPSIQEKTSRIFTYPLQLSKDVENGTSELPSPATPPLINTDHPSLAEEQNVTAPDTGGSNQTLTSSIKATASAIADKVTDVLPSIDDHNVTEQCYPELGCFSDGSPWFTLLRPFPSPWEPEKINTSLFLFTRNRNSSHKVPLWPQIQLDGSDYDPQRRTVFITHGFAADASADWMNEMKDAYLENRDANVFLVDWGPGSKLINYFQAASNTRIVGAELARFGKHLVRSGQSPEHIHAIGHSLGSHISAYFGKGLKSDNHTIGRITALDPAQPGFETEDAIVKLTKDDAGIVDVLHTDARPFIPFFGFGMLQPVGDIDFYMNGGAQQPGCYTVEVPDNITSILDIAKIPVETLSKWVSCSHGRSYDYFTWSLKNKDCLFVGRKMSSVENAFKVGTLGTLRLVDPVVSSVRSCTKDNCSVVGLLSPKIPARGSFAVTTDGEPPYCNKININWDPYKEDVEETYIDEIFKALENSV